MAGGLSQSTTPFGGWLAGLFSEPAPVHARPSEVDCPGVQAEAPEWQMVRAAARDVAQRAALMGGASERFGRWEVCGHRLGLPPGSGEVEVAMCLALRLNVVPLDRPGGGIRRGRHMSPSDGPAAADNAAAHAPRPTLIERIRWQHRFGEMLIERYSDGSVAIDGKLVADTVPKGTGTATFIQGRT